MAEAMKLADLQHGLSAHLRDPDGVTAPRDIEPRRLAIYRELVFNNLDDLLSGNFPVIRALHADSDWRDLVRAFLRDHRCQTPLFTEIGREFIRFLEQRAAAGLDAPYLVELAHYEWSELALALDEAGIEAIPHDPQGDVLDGTPVLSPLVRVLAYHYPVQHIGPQQRPREAPAQPTLILLVRDRADKVGFLEIDALTALLLERLAEPGDASGRARLQAVLVALDRDNDALRASGIAILRELRRRDVLLGTR